MKVLEERLMYLFIVFCKELLCVSIPFWLKDFHLCVYNFLFPSLPHLVLMFSYGSCRPSDLSVSPCFHSFRIVWCSNFGTSSPCIYVLPWLFYLVVIVDSIFCFAVLRLQCVDDFYVNRGIPQNLRQCTMVH